MIRNTLLLAVSASALLSIGGAAKAQSQAGPELSVGGEITGVLDSADPEGPDGGYRYQDFVFDGRAGQRLEAILRSGAFDAYLELYAGEAKGEPVASDDDGLNDGTDSRLRFTPDANQTYVLRARTLSGLEGGDFTLGLKVRPPAPPAPTPDAIALGGSVAGALAAEDPEQDAGGRYDGYGLSLAAGQRIAISLESEAFDPILRIGRMDAGGDFQELAENDDAPGGGLNSFLVFTAPNAGDYVIRATPLDEDSLGDYALKIEAGPEPLASAPIAMGDTVEGELSQDDGANDAGLRADAYRFHGMAGQRVRASMTSDALDAYLELFSEIDGVQESLAQDDDGAGDGTNARLVFVLPADGDYVLEARSFSAEATGAYTLKLSEILPDPAPTPLAFGQTVQGEVGDNDPHDDQERAFDAYAFSGAEGQRIQVIMRSGDFDTYLQVGSAEGEFEALASDDDGLGEGTDSRLNFTLPTAGDYVLRASPLSADTKGLYSLELIDRGPKPATGSLIVGATARGELTENASLAEDGAYYDAYRIQLKKDEKVRIILVSNDFDSVVEVGREKADGSYESLAGDDDSLSDTHARLDWTVLEDGAYVIRARSFAQGQTGSYALSVEHKL